MKVTKLKNTLLNPRMVRALYSMGKKIIVVSGLPGGGKTRSTMEVVSTLKNKVKIVYASPLRRLREYVARQYDGFELKSKTEVCHKLYDIEEEKLSHVQYLIKVFKRCSECNEESSKCPFKSTLKDFISAKNGLWCMTFRMLYIISAYCYDAFKNVILVIDEAENWLDLFDLVMTEKELQTLRIMAKNDTHVAKIIKKILSLTIKLGNRFGYYFLKPHIPLARLIFLVSATLPDDFLALFPFPSNEVYIPRNMQYSSDVEELIEREKEYTIFRVVISSDVKDEFYLYPRKCSWMGTVDGYEPREKWIPKIIKLIDKYYDEGLSIGVASRNYALTKIITGELMSQGYKCYSDIVQDKPPRYAEVNPPYVMIWTTRGRWYRGVSLPDTDIIICTYQSAIDKIPNLSVYRAFEMDIKYAPLMNYCVNTQSYYRSNRMRSKQHKVVFLDLRAWWATKTALKHYSNCRWFAKMKSPEVIRSDFWKNL